MPSRRHTIEALAAVSDVPSTSQGRMVGDCISTSWLGGRAFGPVAVARPHGGTVFSQGLEVPTGGIIASAGGFNSANDKPVPNAAADHASSHSAIRRR